MGGCAAEFCNNSSAKGYIMKIFPRDKHRREQWVKNMNRPNWTPTNSSYLCEVHFAPEMWEPNRIDNKRKLKPHAVPTIFGFFITKRVSFQEPIHRENLQKPTENLLVEREHIIHDVQNQDQSEQEITTNKSLNASTSNTVCENEIFEEKEIENQKCIT